MTTTLPIPIPEGPAVPDSSADQPVFDAAFEASLAWQKNELRPGANALALATYNNAVAAVAASQSAAEVEARVLAADNFKGAWASLPADPLPKPASVWNAGNFWMLLNDLPDPTLSEPGVSADWALLAGYFSSGDVLTTVSTLSPPAWLPTNGAVYSKAAYPVLAAKLPTAVTPPTFRLPDPAALPAASISATVFSPDGVYLVLTSGTAPFLHIYKRNGEVFTKLPDPAALPPATAPDAAFSPDGTYLAVAHGTSPYISVYKRDGDTFTKLPNPAALPTGSGSGVAFSPDGIYLSVAHTTTPFMTVYKRDGDTFIKLANPGTLPTNNGFKTAFSPDGVHLVVTSSTTPFVYIYKRNADVFTKLANPAALPTGIAGRCAFSPDGVYMAVVHEATPFITIYKRSGDTFTKLADPAVLPAVGGSGTGGVAFSPDGAYLAVAHSSAPYITLYKRNGDVFVKEPTFANIPAGAALNCAWWKGSANLQNFLAVGFNVAPYLCVYRDAYAYDPLTEFAVPTVTVPGVDRANTYIRG